MLKTKALICSSFNIAVSPTWAAPAGGCCLLRRYVFLSIGALILELHWDSKRMQWSIRTPWPAWEVEAAYSFCWRYAAHKETFFFFFWGGFPKIFVLGIAPLQWVFHFTFGNPSSWSPGSINSLRRVRNDVVTAHISKAVAEARGGGYVIWRDLPGGMWRGKYGVWKSDERVTWWGVKFMFALSFHHKDELMKIRRNHRWITHSHKDPWDERYIYIPTPTFTKKNQRNSC